MVASIKTLLKRKSLTGKEIGHAYAVSVCQQLVAKQEGKPVKGAFTEADIKALVSRIEDDREGETYNRYYRMMYVINGLYVATQAHYQAAQLRWSSLYQYIICASLQENTYAYQQTLPIIMTRKQYAEEKAARVSKALKEIGDKNLLDLLGDAIFKYTSELQKNPQANNPLSGLRDKYEHEVCDSKLIMDIRLRLANERGKGHYVLDDGRDSAIMGAAEWKSYLLDTLLPYYEKVANIPSRVIRVVLKRMAENGNVSNLLAKYKIPFAGHYEVYPVESLPEESKWETLTGNFLTDSLYDTSTAKAFSAAAKDVMAQFPEAVTAILKDMDSLLYGGKKTLQGLTAGKWNKVRIPARDLYEKNLYGFRDAIDDAIWNDAGRMERNGVAVIEGAASERVQCYDGYETRDKRGYFKEYDVTQNEISGLSLTNLFPESENYADATARIEDDRQQFILSVRAVKGFKRFVQIAADVMGVPELKVFEPDTDKLDYKTKSFNESINMVKHVVVDTAYDNEGLQQKKLRAIDDNFLPLNNDDTELDQLTGDVLRDMIEDGRAFTPDYYSTIADLVQYGRQE